MFTSAQKAGQIAAQLGGSFDPLRKQQLEAAAGLRAKNEALQALLRTRARSSADQVLRDADSQLELVALRASQKPPPAPAAEEALLDADHFPQDTTRLLGNKIWKVATGDDGVKYWVPVHVPSCSFPTAFITDRHRSLETGFAKNTVQTADMDALQQLHQFQVPKDMPPMPAVIGTRAGQYLQQAQRAEQEGCERQTAEMRMNAAKRDYYRTIGYLSTDDMKAAETELGRAQVKFRMQTKQKEAVEGEQRKLEGELLVAKSYMSDMKEEFYAKQTESDTMGMRFAVESLRLARYKVVVLMKQKRRMNAKLKIYQCNYKEARQHMLLAKQCFEQKLKKHEAAKIVMRANGDLPEEKTPKEQLKDEQTKVAAAKEKLALMEAEYAKMKVRETNLQEAIDRFKAKSDKALQGAGGNADEGAGKESDAATLQGGSVVQGGVNQKEQEMIRKLLESQKETDDDEEGLLRALLQRKGTTSSGEVKNKISELEKLFGAKKQIGSDLAEEQKAQEHDMRDAKKDIAKYVQQMKADAVDDLREMADMQRRSVDQERERAAKELKKVEYEMVQNVVGAVDDFRNDADNALLSTGKEIKTQEGLVLGIQQQLLNHKRLKALQTEMEKLAKEIQLLRDAIQVMQGHIAELIDTIRQTDAGFMKEKTAEELEQERLAAQRLRRQTEEADRVAQNKPTMDIKEATVEAITELTQDLAGDKKMEILTLEGHGVVKLESGDLFAHLKYGDDTWYDGFVDEAFLPHGTGVLVQPEDVQKEKQPESGATPTELGFARYRGEWERGDFKKGFKESFNKTEAVPVEVMFSSFWNTTAKLPPMFKTATTAAPASAPAAADEAAAAAAAADEAAADEAAAPVPVAKADPVYNKVKSGKVEINCDQQDVEKAAEGGFGYRRLDGKFIANCKNLDAGTTSKRQQDKVVIQVGQDPDGNQLLMYGALDTKDCGPNAFYSWQWNEKTGSNGTVFLQVGAEFDEKADVTGYVSNKLQSAWKWMWGKIGYQSNDMSLSRKFEGVVQSGFHCETNFKADTRSGKFLTKSGTFVDKGSTVFACEGEVLYGVPHGRCTVYYTGKTTDLDNVFDGMCANGTPVAGFKQIWQEDEAEYVKFWGTFLSPTASNDDCWYSKMNTGRRQLANGQAEYVYLRRSFDKNLRFEASGKAVYKQYPMLSKLCTNRAVKSTVSLDAERQVPTNVYKEFVTPLINDEDGCKIRGGSVALSGGAHDSGERAQTLSLLGIDVRCKIPHIDAGWLKEVEDKVAQLVLRMDVVVQKEQEYNSLLDTQKLLPANADPAMTAQTTEARRWILNEKKDLTSAVVAYTRSLRDALERCPRDGPGALRAVARTLAEATKQTFRCEYKDPMCVLSDWLKYEF